MNIESFAANEFIVQGSTLLVSISIAIFVLFILLVYIINLRIKLHSTGNHNYGFLGKSLYQIITFVVIIGGLTFSAYSLTSPDTGLIRTNAVEQIDAELSHTILQRGLKSQIRYKVIPILNGINWGGNIKNKFNIFVNFDNNSSINEFMYDRNKDTGAIFEKIMSRGTYDVTITIIHNNTSKKINKKLVLK